MLRVHLYVRRFVRRIAGEVLGMGLLARCCSVLFVVLMLLVTSRPLFAEEPAPLLRIGCLDVSDFPDDAPERLLVSYTRHYLDEISRSTGWQYQYMPMDERTAREMLRQGSIDMYFPAQRMGTDESEFSLSAEGAAYSILSVYAMEDSALAANEPAALNNKKIGVLDTELHAYALTSLGREQGVRADPVVYETSDELHRALSLGEVDAVIDRASCMRDDEKLLLRVALLPARFLASKKREGLLKNLSDVILYTRRVNPSFETQLSKMFLDRAQAQLVRFTATEEAYLASAPVLRVAYVSSHAPFFDEPNAGDVPDGIYPSVLRMLGETIGLYFNFVPAEDNDHALKMLRTGEADLFFCVYNNASSVRDLYFTSTFAMEDFSYVVRRGTNEIPPGPVRVALSSWFVGARTYLNEQHPDWQIVPVAEPADCLRLLEDGGCDYAFLPSLFLQQSGILATHPGLTVLASYSAELPVSIAISGDRPRILQSVLTKGLLKLDSRRAREIVNEHMTSRLTLTTAIMRYPVQTVALACVVLLALFLALFLVSRSRIERRQTEILRRKNEELEQAVEEQKKLMRARDIYKQEAEIDPLTGLLNKKAIRAVYEEMVAAPLKDGAFHAFFIMDLDHFKEMNDTYGHQAGDDVLRRFADDIRSIFRQSDHIGRFGGDEFTALMPNVTTLAAVEHHARRLMSAAQELEVRDDRSLLSVSIGVALVPMHGTAYDDVFMAADAALYDVKRAGRNGWKVYDAKKDGGILCTEGK